MIHNDEFYERIGAISLKALNKGGTLLLDHAIIEMGLASRHLDRYEKGLLPKSHMVDKEILYCLNRVEKIIEDYKE